jgi:hypothetical protein
MKILVSVDQKITIVRPKTSFCQALTSTNSFVVIAQFEEHFPDHRHEFFVVNK